MHKLRKVWLALGWLWVVALVYLSLTPNPPEPVRFLNADKLEHALAYCLLMLWFCQVYVRRMQRLFTGALLVAMGVAMEFLQGMTGYRSFQYADMLANSIGVLLGWAWARTALGRVGRALETRFLK
ncbi:MAG TPA: VanZ family protein [Gallionella sp.]|nr:VanZ family protein [Gallionella sp.]